MSAVSDEGLALRAQQGCPHAANELIRRHWRRAEYCASRYYVAGLDRDDLIQAGWVGGLRALRDWRPDGGRTIGPFLQLAIERAIQTEVKAANREKRGGGERPGSLDQRLRNAEGEDAGELIDFMPDRRHDTVGQYEDRELLSDLTVRLSKLELALLPYALSNANWDSRGGVYALAAARLGLRHKQIDNAMQRIRRKAAALERAAA